MGDIVSDILGDNPPPKPEDPVASILSAVPPPDKLGTVPSLYDPNVVRMQQALGMDASAPSGMLGGVLGFNQQVYANHPETQVPESKPITNEQIIKESSPLDQFLAGLDSTLYELSSGTRRTFEEWTPWKFPDNSFAQNKALMDAELSSSSLAGKAGGVVGSIAEFGLAGLAPEIGIPTIFAAGYGNGLKKVDEYAQQTGAQIDPGVRQTIAVGMGVVDSALMLLPGLKFAKGVTGSLYRQIGEAVMKGSFEDLTKIALHEGLGAAKSAAFMGVGQLSHNALMKWINPEQSLTEGVGEAAITGAVLHGLGDVIAGTRGVIAGQAWKDPTKYSQFLIREGSVRPGEAQTVANDPEKLKAISLARRSDRLPVIDANGNVQSVPDVVPWQHQVALDHNDALIQAERTRVLNGKSAAVYLTPDVGPVKPEELSTITSALDSTLGKIKLEDGDVNPKTGSPITRRALLVGDIEYIRNRLAAESAKPQGRSLLEQAKALVRSAEERKIYDDKSELPPNPKYLGARGEILTPIDMSPGSQIQFVAVNAKEQGYLRPAEQITDDTKLRGKISRLQEQFYNQIAALNDPGTKLPEYEKWPFAKKLEQDFIDKMDIYLEQNDNSSKGARKQVVRRITQALPKIDQPNALQVMDDTIKRLSENLTTLTQRETVGLLAQELRYGTQYVPENVIAIVDKLYRDITSGKADYQPWGTRTQQRLNDINSELAKATQGVALAKDTQEKVLEMVKDLKPEYQAPLLRQVMEAQTPEALRTAVEQTKIVVEGALKENTRNEIKSLIEKLGKGTRKVQGLETIQRVIFGRMKEAQEVLAKAGIKGAMSDALVRSFGAFHGSAADFERFSNEKIGTGEGAQAYGYGHYFASKKEVADWYRQKLTDARDAWRFVGKQQMTASMQYTVSHIKSELSSGKTFDEAVAAVKADLEEVGPKRNSVSSAVELARQMLLDLPKLKEEDFVAGNKGKLYHVQLAPNEDELLDWDRPISEQSPKIQEALKKAAESSPQVAEALKWQKQYNRENRPEKFNGANFYSHLADQYGIQSMQQGGGKTQQIASNELRKAGIRGIRYLEGASRAKGEGNHNYVIFDPADITITHKEARRGGGLEALWQEVQKNTPDKLTPEQEQRVAVAKDESKFNELSPEHKRYNERWNRLVKVGAMSDEDATLLRYLFQDISPEVLKSVKSIRSPKTLAYKTETGDIHVGHPGDYQWTTQSLRIARMTEAKSPDRVRVFLHEFFHAAYYNFIDAAKAGELEQLHKTLVENGQAHQIITHGMPWLPKDTIDYYANDPAEFFAEAGARYVLEKKAPNSVIREVFNRIVNRAVEVFNWMTKNKATAKLLPNEYKTVFEGVLRGEKFDTKGVGQNVANFLSAPLTSEARGAEPTGVIRTNKAGKQGIDQKALDKYINAMTTDQVIDLRNELAKVVRQGEIERGLYSKWLKFRTGEDSKNVISKLPTENRSLVFQKADKALHVGKLVVDPVTIEGWLYQAAKGDQSNPLYSILSANFVDKFSRHMQNIAMSRKFVLDKSREILGLFGKGVKGEYQLHNYMAKELENGITRGEAMWAYALSTDKGRAEALKKAGIVSRDTQFDLADSIKLLSDQDREFVDQTKDYLHDNHFIEQGFKNFTLINGVEPERFDKWFTSRREYTNERLADDFASWSTQIQRDVDALKERADTSSKPFRLDGGYLAAFHHVTDTLSRFGELGIEAYRAEKLLTDTNFKKSFIAKFGQARYESLELYLKHIFGRIGHRQSALDAVVNYGISSWQVGKVAWNLISATKQLLHVFTMLGDNTISARSISKAMLSGAGLSREVGDKMLNESGLAYMRYDGGRFIEAQAVLGRPSEGGPSTLRYLQNKSMVLQRMADRFVMKIAWRAAELDAAKAGLKGNDALAYARSKFELTAGRDQPTDAPLYSSELELQAIRQPLLRGSLAFMREQNRIYNVIRRHIALAKAKPTLNNLGNAAKALLFAGIANTVAVVALNELRRQAFGKPAGDSGKLTNDAITSLAGAWYLMAPVDQLVQGLIDPKTRFDDVEQALGPIAGTLVKAGRTVYDIHDYLSADESALVKQGIARGEDQRTRFLEKTLDDGTDVLSSVLGLPFWALWYQGKGLYTWERPDYRLMVQLEADRTELNKQPNINAGKLQQLNLIKERINEIHGLRAKGLLSKEAARSAVIRELEREYP